MKILNSAAARSLAIIWCVVAATCPAAPFGAMAVGEPMDVAEDGAAYGWSVGLETREKAGEAALEECLASATDTTRKLCKVVETFEKQCVAVAMDKEAGTPGRGWAVKTKKADAENAAMDLCRLSAGLSRASFCEVISECDGTAAQ